MDLFICKMTVHVCKVTLWVTNKMKFGRNDLKNHHIKKMRREAEQELAKAETRLRKRGLGL